MFFFNTIILYVLLLFIQNFKLFQIAEEIKSRSFKYQ